MAEFRGTTICAVKRDGKTAIAGDGQVTMGESVVFKNNAVKVRRIFGGRVILGFAGSVSDAFSLSERFEGMLNKFSGNLMRSAVELAELWRNDKMVRKLDALMIVADKDQLLIISGNGEVIEPDGGVCAIGSGGTTPSRRRAPSRRKRSIPPKRSPTRRSRSPARSASIPTTTSRWRKSDRG